MGVGNGVYIGRLRPQALFLVLACAVWISFFSVVECARVNPLVVNMVFAIGAGIIAYSILKFLGYFSLVRLVPRKSDLLLVLFAIPCGAALMHLVSIALYGQAVCGIKELIIWTPFLSFLVFGAHFAVLRFALGLGTLRTVLCDLMPHEEESLREDFRVLGLYKHYKIINTAQFKGPLSKATLKNVSLVVVSPYVPRHVGEDSVLIYAHLAGVPIVEFGGLSSDLLQRIKLANLDLCTYVLHATPQTLLLRGYSKAKIIMEPVIAIMLAVLLSPLALFLALAIRSTSRGPVLIRQSRVGLHGENFTLLKFRSMYEDAEINGPQWAAQNDNRVTTLGRFMRATRLDELPQLWNVIRGEMSFFGPRPERPELYAKLKQDIPLFPMRTLVRPGITGWAQVCAGYAASVAESRIKLEYDLYYIQHMSARLDLIVVIKTFLVLFGGSKRQEARRFLAQPVPLEMLRA